jgi:zinc transporter ZupT
LIHDLTPLASPVLDYYYYSYYYHNIKMKSFIPAVITTGVSLLGLAKASTVQGFDISHYQPSVDFAAAYSSGARFVIIKVSENITQITKHHTRRPHSTTSTLNIKSPI